MGGTLAPASVPLQVHQHVVDRLRDAYILGAAARRRWEETLPLASLQKRRELLQDRCRVRRVRPAGDAQGVVSMVVMTSDGRIGAAGAAGTDSCRELEDGPVADSALRGVIPGRGNRSGAAAKYTARPQS